MIRTIVKALRKDLGLTQAGIAEIIGVSKTSYSNYENNISNLANENMKKLEEYLSNYYIIAKDKDSLIILKKVKGE